MARDIKPLSANVGLEISGIDLDLPIDSSTSTALQDAFLASGILLVPARRERHPRPIWR